MAYLEQIVKVINDAILEELPTDNVHSICLAQQMIRIEGDKKTIFPCQVDKDGEGIYIGPDDDHEIILYHRVNNITVGKSSTIKTYGDNKAADVHFANISLVVFGQRDKLKIRNDELALRIHGAMPEAMEKDMTKKMRFFAVNVNVTEIILDDMRVFNEEYTSVGYFLKPEQFLFKINYRIESAFLKKCLKKCGC